LTDAARAGSTDSAYHCVSPELAMIDALAAKLDGVAALCGRYGVNRLEVFGSAAAGDFNPSRSDIDFIVEFQPDMPMGPWMSRYFSFRDDLAALLGWPVDLMMANSPGLKNPYFAREVGRSRRLVYAA